MSLTTVKLAGPMGKRFGREFKLHLDTNTPSEAVRALCSIVEGFKDYLSRAHDRGIEFAIFRGKAEHAENIGFEQLLEPAGGTIRIAPIHVGSKSGGVLQTIVGVVLIVVGAVGSTLGWWAGGSVWGPLLVSMGVSMVAGGVIQMLSPQPKVKKGTADSADNQASYIFNGPVNTTAQGGCVPVLYGGPMEIGSMIISAGIEAVDYSSRPSNVPKGTVGGNFKQTPYDPD